MKHILIDYENIQPTSLAQLNVLEQKIWLFLGKNQTKLDVELVKCLTRFGTNIEFIQVSKNGKNALDFYIAFYIGCILTSDPQAAIYIFSRDTDYDALLQHINEDTPFQGARIEFIDQFQQISSPSLNRPYLSPIQQQA